MPNTAAIEICPPASLREVYALMARTRDVRVRVVARCLEGQRADADDIRSLKNAKVSLERIPRSPGGGGFELALDAARHITVDLSYEINELGKDLILLEKGEEALYEHLGNLHPSFAEQVRLGTEFLGSMSFRSLITDRDGTVNNYCGRYNTSIQSVYNAVFLTRFAGECVRNAVMLTSAPLRNVGLMDVATAPAGAFIYAASKGREYLDREGRHGTYPVEPRQQAVLDELNARLSDMLSQPGYEKFTLIGSGLQKKFGQTTISRQDINGSIPQQESLEFRDAVEELVWEIDANHEHFRIEETGLDIEIVLTVGAHDGGGLKDFDKGDAVRFLDGALGLGLSSGPTLVCGDTASDIPMVSACVDRDPDSCAVFATVKQDLKNNVTQTTSRSYFVDTPDTLVAILHEVAKTGHGPRRG